MPYIQKSDRDRAKTHPRTAGELNFAFTTLILEYLRTKQGSYQTVNDIIGALEGAKLEFYRRCVAQYEDFKARTNGDVYDIPSNVRCTLPEEEHRKCPECHKAMLYLRYTSGHNRGYHDYLCKHCGFEETVEE